MAKKRMKIPKRQGGQSQRKKGNDMMRQLSQLQEQMMQSQEKLNEEEFTGSAGGGVVSATVKGSMEVVSVKIDPDAVDEDDIEMLEDLVVAAINDAQRKASEAAAEGTEALTSGLGNIDLGDLGGLAGNIPGF